MRAWQDEGLISCEEGHVTLLQHDRLEELSEMPW